MKWNYGPLPLHRTLLLMWLSCVHRPVTHAWEPGSPPPQCWEGGLGRAGRWKRKEMEWTSGPEEAAVCPDVTYLACTLPGLLAAHITVASVQRGILQSCGILFQRIECYVFRPIFFFFPNCIWNNPSGIMQVRLPVRANQKCEQVIYWWVKLGSHHGTISTNPWNLEANLT